MLVSLAPLYYPDTLVNLDTCLGGSYFKSDITIIFMLKAGYINVFCMYFMKILCNMARSRFLATQKKAFRLKLLDK